MACETEIIVARVNKMTNRALSWLSSCFTEKCQSVCFLQRLENIVCRGLYGKFLSYFAA